MGPNSDDREVMKQLVLNGMDVARFNFFPTETMRSTKK